MRPTEYETCTFCPRLCRHVCPIAVGSAREAATPTSMMSGPWMFAAELLGATDAGALAALCTSCGACTAHCHLRRPVAELLAEARAELLPPAQIDPIGEIEGDDEWIAVESDDRAWSQAAAARLGRPLARLRTRDHLGEALLDHPDLFAAHAAALRAAVGQRALVVGDLGCLKVARAAGIPALHLADLLPLAGDEPVFHPCHGPRLHGDPVADALACCGAAPPLSRWHPEIASEVASAAARALGESPVRCPDARCAGALRTAGAQVRDPVSELIREPTPPR